MKKKKNITENSIKIHRTILNPILTNLPIYFKSHRFILIIRIDSFYDDISNSYELYEGIIN